MAAGSPFAGKDIVPHWTEGVDLAGQRHIPDSLDGGEGQGQGFRLRSGTGGNREARAPEEPPWEGTAGLTPGPVLPLSLFFPWCPASSPPPHTTWG